jgi:hypothetical protein
MRPGFGPNRTRSTPKSVSSLGNGLVKREVTWAKLTVLGQKLSFLLHFLSKKKIRIRSTHTQSEEHNKTNAIELQWTAQHHYDLSFVLFFSAGTPSSATRRLFHVFATIHQNFGMCDLSCIGSGRQLKWGTFSNVIHIWIAALCGLLLLSLWKFGPTSWKQRTMTNSYAGRSQSKINFFIWFLQQKKPQNTNNTHTKRHRQHAFFSLSFTASRHTTTSIIRRSKHTSAHHAKILHAREMTVLSQKSIFLLDFFSKKKFKLQKTHTQNNTDNKTNAIELYWFVSHHYNFFFIFFFIFFFLHTPIQ